MSIICDLDGVVYRGEQLIPGSDTALKDAQAAGLGLYFATNNSTRTPIDVAEKLERVAGFQVDPASIVTSSQAAASILSSKDFPIYVLGSKAILAAMDEAGVETTAVPEAAGSVVVGMDWDLTYDKLAKAASSVRNGARFIATNTDATYPAENQTLPGSGAIVAAIATAAGVNPEVAGKPHVPMRRLLQSKVAGAAWVIGDRLETDIALAVGIESWKSVIVLTGIAAPDDDLAEADYVAADLRKAVDLVLDAEKG